HRRRRARAREPSRRRAHVPHLGPSRSIGLADALRFGAGTRRRGLSVDLWVLILIIAAAVSVSASAMLVARGLAPEGGFFVNPGRVGGVFSVLGSSFAVLLAFVI